MMGIGPISSTQKALERSDGISMISMFSKLMRPSRKEAVINELSIDYQKVNIDGGAISIGILLSIRGENC